jgi:hypothetical protein
MQPSHINVRCNRPGWIRAVMVLSLLSAFGWFEWQHLWDNRWAGFLLGAAVMPAALWVNWGRGGLRFNKAYPWFAGFFFLVATVTFVGFFLRPAHNFDAFGGFVCLTLGTHLALRNHWFSKKSSQKQMIHHG